MYPVKIGWHDAEVILIQDVKKPLLVISTPVVPSNAPGDPSPVEKSDLGKIQTEQKSSMCRREAQLSVSHERDHAIAVVLAVNAPFGILR
jgi:hypothetical protein